MFTDEDEIIARTAEQVTYRREGLEPEASGSVRVRSAAGTDDDRITSDWSTHVTGMAMAVPVAPPTPTGLAVSATETSITWTWTAAPGAQGYVVQISEDEVFETMFEGADHYAVTRETSHTIAGLEAETTRYARVAAGVLTGAVPSLDPGDYLLSAWTIHATGMTEAAAPERPPAPANVRLRTRGSDFLEWTWDAVEGASGYQSQFSASSTFPSGQAGSEIHQGMASTTRRVANLDAESEGHLRVRTYTGTLTEPTYGDWSDGHRATTAEPPPAVALGAPEGLRGSAETATSITLTWDEVDDADTYEVRQREPGGAWSDASCGSATADNEVADEECVASGLDSGTDYDFGVRALPANNDRAHNASAWSDTLESRTTGTSTTTPPPTTGGGSGNLNVRWESTATSITWIWDRVGEGRYDFVVSTATTYSDSSNPCTGTAVTWPADANTAGYNSAQTSHTLTSLSLEPGNTRLLCVRPHDEEDDVSFAWAITTPALPAAGTFTDREDGSRTTSVQWTVANIAGGFNYDLRTIATPGRDNVPASASELGSACASGAVVAQGDTDVPLVDVDVPFSQGLQSFTRYSLCMRYHNAKGQTSWVATTGQVTTLPAAPPRPVVDSSRTTLDHDTASKVVWTLPVRSRRDVPRNGAEFDARTLSYREKYDHDSDTGTALRTVTSVPSRDVQAACSAGTLSTPGFDPSESALISATDNPQGITVESGEFARPELDDPDLDDRRVQLCVRVKAEGGWRAGPWVISDSSEIRQKTE